MDYFKDYIESIDDTHFFEKSFNIRHLKEMYGVEKFNSMNFPTSKQFVLHFEEAFNECNEDQDTTYELIYGLLDVYYSNVGNDLRFGHDNISYMMSQRYKYLCYNSDGNVLGYMADTKIVQSLIYGDITILDVEEEDVYEVFYMSLRLSNTYGMIYAESGKDLIKSYNSTMENAVW